MNRRSFVKGIGAFLCVCYVNPLKLAPTLETVETSVRNHFVMPNEIAAEALKYLDEYLVFDIQKGKL